MSSTLRRIGIAPLVGLFASLASGGERSYTFYDIGFFGCPPDPFTEATDLNDMGVVTGFSSTPDCTTGHALTWINGILTDLDDTSEEGIFYGVEAISQAGVMLGAGDPDKLLVLRDGMAVPLPVPPGCETQGNGRGINDAGTMAVGQCDTNGSGVDAPAVYWIEDGTALALDLFDDLPADATGEARDVNDDGVVVGIVDGIRSFIWQDGVLTEIFNGLGGEGVTVWAINNHGLIVGLAHDGPAMSYDMNTGVMRALGDGTAKAVNDRGVAVGDKTIDFSSEHAILYENGEEIDLHEFFPPYFVNTDAEAINNYGWIVGDADDSENRTHGFLLVPVYDKGDYDGDTDVDHQDFQHFQRCFAAEPYIDGTLHVGCSVFDFDDDVDLDLDDYAAFQSAFTGPTAPNLNPNGPG
ncbi:MAG: hypothetical protein IID37_17370 [Planctomycetes bacterium]|nr:hypothetical protein [Planctomycetota bacterium]